MVKVSIIVPVYNVENYLKECMDSLIHQSLKDIEIICVNDGSTDSSLSILEEYGKNDKRIIITSKENGGYGKAMNIGLENANGEYIGIAEPDDYVDLHMFEDLYNIAVDNKLDFVKADFYRFVRDEKGQEQLTYEHLDREKKYYNQVFDPSQTPYAIRFTLNTWSGIYRKAFLDKYNIRHHETPGASFQDNGFYFQTFVYGQRAMIVDHPYYYNRRDNPNSSVKSKDKVYCMNIEYDYIQDILKKDPEIWFRFRNMYWWKKYHNYRFTIDRIDKRYRPEFITRMGMEYKRALQLSEINPQDFTESEWRQILQIVHDGKKFYKDYIDIPEWQIPIRRILPAPVKKVIKRLIGRKS